MQQPIFAKDLKVGDKINGHCDGWLTVLQVDKNKCLSHGDITVYFMNGNKRTYDEYEKIEAVRI